MATNTSPTWASFAFDVPEPENLDGEFFYNYFVKDERVTENTLSDLEAADRHGGEPARHIKLTFTPLSSITNLELPTYTTRQRKDHLVSRSNLILSEVAAQTSRTSFVAVQDDGIAQQLQSIIDAELLASKVESRGLSPLEAALKYNSVTSDRINANDILETTDVEASSNLTYYDPATGEDITVQKQGAVSEYAVGGFYNKKFLYDILKGAESSPFSPLWGNINSILEDASGIQEESISSLDSNKITMEDYELPVSYIPETALDLNRFTSYGETVTVCGYMIEKQEVHSDGTTTSIMIIPITDLELSEYVDTKVTYGKRYRYNITSVFYLSTTVIDPVYQSGMAYATFMVGSRGSPYIDVLCEETVPPPPPSNIEFYLSQEQKLIIFWNMPFNTQEDIKRFQIFKRASLEDPYTIISEIDFDDSEILTTRSEFIPDYSKIVKESSALSLNFTDEDFEFDTEFYYAICSVDAHDLSSPYSSQFKVRYDRIDGKMKVELVGFAGAPKPYPNFTLKETLIVDCLKDSGHSKMKIYFDPECLVLQGSSKESVHGTKFREDLEFIETNNSSPMYKVQIINLDRQQDQKLNIYLKNDGSPGLPHHIKDKIPHQDITD